MSSSLKKGSLETLTRRETAEANLAENNFSRLKLSPLQTNPAAHVSFKSSFSPRVAISTTLPNKTFDSQNATDKPKSRLLTDTSPLKTSQLLSPVNKEKPGINVKDFITYMHQKKLDKFDQTSRSFVSFIQMPNGDPLQSGGGERGEVFMNPNNADHWWKQLKLNKEREKLFKNTIQDIFMQSNQSFYKARQEKDKKMQKMPHVKIYTTTKSLVQNRPKLTFLEPSMNEIPAEEKSQISEYSARVRINKNEPYKFFLLPPGDPSLRRPYAREGASMTVLGKYVYLYGGVSKEVYNEWDVLDTTAGTWAKVTVKGDIPPYGRFGHSADRYYNSVIVFGGEKSYNTILKIRECVNDVRIFMPDNSEWKYLKCQGEFVEPRRNHVGVVVGKHLLIHGGIDTLGNYLEDIKVLSLTNNRWSSVEEKGSSMGAVAFHRACLIMSSNRKELNLFKMPDLKAEDVLQKQISVEGIYFFGGKSSEGESYNALKILKIGSHVLEWITPATAGRAPDPRFLHAMVHCRKYNFLAVYGGQSLGFYSERKTPYLGDISLLYLDTLSWTNVIMAGGSPGPRCSHSVAVVGSKIIVFGGIHYNSYSPSDHQIIETDPIIVAALEKKNEKKKSIEAPDSQSLIQSVQHLGPLALKKPISHRQTQLVSFLPMPMTEDSPKKLRMLSKKEVMEKVMGRVRHYEEHDL